MIIPPAPSHITETKLYAALTEKEGAGGELLEKTNRLIELISPLLDLIITGPFRTYTLHNRDHSKKIVHLIGHILNDTVLNKLSALECAVLIYSAYLHDVGMCVTSTERRRLLESEEFDHSIRDWPVLLRSIQATRAQLYALGEPLNNETSTSERRKLEGDLFQMHEAALAAFLRPRHAERDRYIATMDALEQQSGRPDLFEVRGISFKQLLIDICVSHNQDAATLLQARDIYEDMFPRDLVLAGETINAQFCAALLRVADVLDFDRERTPRILVESIGLRGSAVPGSEVSLVEWEKHLAVHTIEISEQEIVISGVSKHPIIERSIRSFAEIIERELRDTGSVLRRNRAEVLARYEVELPMNVRTRIRSEGYVYKDMFFQLNQFEILNLLMGHRLYTRPTAAVRELIQNAVDACAARQALEGGNSNSAVVVFVEEDAEGRMWLSVKDTGIGMDEHVLSEYFFKIGSSYYSSTEFAKLSEVAGKQFIPVARFGIGVISIFMIADVIEVVTKRAHSPRGDTTSRFLRVEGQAGLAFVTETSGGTIGTTVRARLHPTVSNDMFLDELAAYLRQEVVHPAVPVEVHLGDHDFILRKHTTLTFRPEAVQRLQESGVEPIVIQLSRWSDTLEGTVVLFFRIARSETTGRVSYYRAIMGGGRDVFESYPGNRFTVNGFRMSFKSSSRLFGKKNRLPAVFDINVKGTAEVEYAVSRERLTGRGITFVRRNVREAVRQGLRELGYWNHIAADIRGIFGPEERSGGGDDDPATKIPTADDRTRPDKTWAERSENKEVIERVASMLPPDNWPRFIHKDIARELGVSNHAVSRAIRALIASGRIANPSDHNSNSPDNRVPPTDAKD